MELRIRGERAVLAGPGGEQAREVDPHKLAIGAAWPGFDDRKASWSENRFMDARCGKTFEESLRLWRKFYTSSDPLPFLLVVTWNDYEEGTAIERGTNNCTPSKPTQIMSGGASKTGAEAAAKSD